MFELSESTADVFRFTYKGKEYAIPSRASLPLPVFRRIRKAISESDNPEEEGFDQIMALFDEYIPDVMEELSFEQAVKLFTAYANGGEDATMGES